MTVAAEPFRAAGAKARDEGLRRLSRTTRIVVAGAAALSGLFAWITASSWQSHGAAKTTPVATSVAQVPSAATATGTAASAATALANSEASSAVAEAQAQAAQTQAAQAPSSTSSQPVAVSSPS
jgi:hypothetical protein